MRVYLGMFVCLAACVSTPPGTDSGTDPGASGGSVDSPGSDAPGGVILIDDAIGSDQAAFDRPFGATLDVLVQWPELCTGGLLDGSCTTPTATARVTTSGVDASIAQTWNGPSGHSDNRGGYDLEYVVRPEAAGTMQVAVTSTNATTGETMTGSATVHVLALTDIQLCALEGTSSSTSGPCATSIAAGTPFGIEISGDFEGQIWPIAPTITWTGLGSIPEPTCRHDSNTQQRDVVWCAFPAGLQAPASVTASYRGLDRTLAIAIQ